MQTNRSIRQSLGGAVFQITQNRATHGAQLGPDLVRPTGKRFHFEQVQVSDFVQGLVSRNALLCIPMRLAGTLPPCSFFHLSANNAEALRKERVGQPA
jgi:hypothetical protein